MILKLALAIMCDILQHDTDQYGAETLEGLTQRRQRVATMANDKIALLPCKRHDTTLPARHASMRVNRHPDTSFNALFDRSVLPISAGVQERAQPCCFSVCSITRRDSSHARVG